MDISSELKMTVPKEEVADEMATISKEVLELVCDFLQKKLDENETMMDILLYPSMSFALVAELHRFLCDIGAELNVRFQEPLDMLRGNLMAVSHARMLSDIMNTVKKHSYLTEEIGD